MTQKGERGRRTEGPKLANIPLRIGRRCARRVNDRPIEFQEAAAWLLSQPDGAKAPHATPQHFGSILHRLSAAKNELIERYREEPDHVVDRLTVTEANRIILYTALVLVPHFDATGVGISWPWEETREGKKDGRAWMKLGSDAFGLAKLANRCLLIAADSTRLRDDDAERTKVGQKGAMGEATSDDPLITVVSSSQRRGFSPEASIENEKAGRVLRREIHAWVAAGGEARKQWLLGLWERSLIVPSEFPGMHDRRLWSQLDRPDRLAMHAQVVIGIHDAESSEPVVPDALYAEWNKPEGAKPDWTARGRAAIGVGYQPLTDGHFDPSLFDADLARQSFVALSAAEPTTPGEAVPGGSANAAGSTARGSVPSGTDESAGPALTASQSRVLQTMALFNAELLASADAIEAAMDAGERLSARTIGPIVRKLISLGFAERPEGGRSGARLTTAGRRLASKIAD